jgi:sterol desaturase/sphingolipid hydroxylase (fatty acid hydroxylase superfamily)
VPNATFLLDLNQYVYPIFFVMIVVEAIVLLRNRGAFPWLETATSLIIALGGKFFRPFTFLAQLLIFVAIWQIAPWEIPLNTWWGIALLVVTAEFAYYWMHRTSHRSRWMWAQHSIHHSTEDMAFSAAYRLGWTSLIGGNWVFWAPVVFIGFHPVAVLLAYAAVLIYQFWLHTDVVPKLGALEWVLNTPSHHRVHHAANEEYVDRNFGGITVVFDRLFGTLVVEDQAVQCRYGLVKPIGSGNPLRILFHEWISLFEDVAKAKGWRTKLSYAFAHPGWTPEAKRTATPSCQHPTLLALPQIAGTNAGNDTTPSHQKQAAHSLSHAA